MTKEILLDHNSFAGQSKLPEYSVWLDAKRRVFNPNNKRYKHYGERGITMAPEWRNNFPAFYEHVGKRPVDGQRWSLGRIDNNGDYAPDNVRWETDVEQARNHKLQENNKTGTIGIQLNKRWIGNGLYTTYIAVVSLACGKKKTKNFSVDKYGEEVAKEMAVNWRKEQLLILETVGIIYAESHGV